MNRILFSMAFFCVSITAFSQDPIRIDTDRPDQTESPFTVPKKYFQGEFGFNKENFDNKDYNILFPTFLLKYGLHKRFELRLESSLTHEYLHLQPTAQRST